MESKILFTKDLGQFKIMDGNRAIDRNHVSRLKESLKITGNSLLKQRPIIINDKGEIVDGQHRFVACSELGLPIYYVNTNNYNLNEVMVLNCNNKNWSMIDFASMFASQGKKDYEYFLMFKEQHGIDCDSAAALLAGNHRFDRAMFRSGHFKVKNIRQAQEAIEKIYDFKSSYVGFKRRSFVAACLTMFKTKGYSHNVMKQKLELGIGRNLQHVPQTRMYLQQLETIYNYKNSKNKLRFS